MLGKRRSDRVCNEYISEKTKVQDVTAKIKSLKWKLSILINFWYPRVNKRRRRGQYRRWEDELMDQAGLAERILE